MVMSPSCDLVAHLLALHTERKILRIDSYVHLVSHKAIHLTIIKQKNRGKRIRTDESENTSPSETSPTSPVSSTAGDDTNPAKKPKFAEPTVAVRRYMRFYLSPSHAAYM